VTKMFRYWFSIIEPLT